MEASSSQVSLPAPSSILPAPFWGGVKLLKMLVGAVSYTHRTAFVRGDCLEELDRLELAEHLAYCDQCLQRYTELLSEGPMLTPARSCRESLRRRIRQRAVQLGVSRYATAAAAVTLALTLLWGSGNLSGRVHSTCLLYPS